MADDIIIITAK